MNKLIIGKSPREQIEEELKLAKMMPHRLYFGISILNDNIEHKKIFKVDSPEFENLYANIKDMLNSIGISVIGERITAVASGHSEDAVYDFLDENRAQIKMQLVTGKIIAVDFDGTLCADEWPAIGSPNYGMIEFAKALAANDNKLILWSCRTGDDLQKALFWCRDHELYFEDANENLYSQKEKFGGDTRKIYADYYIDDKNANID